MKTEIKVDTKDFERTLRKLGAIVDSNWQSAGQEFRRITPRRSGNAQSKSTYNSKEIRGNYPYAGRLDEGYSKQAPAGMSDPTIRNFVSNIEKDIGRL